MPNTYTQIYNQVVFAVQGRHSLIPANHMEELYKYITGIVKNRGQKLIAINGVGSHVHILIGIKPGITISDLVRDIKAGSSGFINEKKWIHGRFNWQEGFSAFSYSHSDIHRVANYIENQEEHHRIKTFREEYIEMLKEFAINYDERYIFADVDSEQAAPMGL
jgi:putative transposase